MAFLRGFGSYVPERVVGNEELAPMLGVDPAWILEVSGIRERRYAGAEERVADLAVKAAEDCLRKSGVRAAELGMLVVASGSAERFAPGPAGVVAARLGMGTAPAMDVAVPSAGSLIGMVMAMRFAPGVGRVLLVASEIMSRRVRLTPEGKNTAILFGDGAGACLVDDAEGFLRLADALIYTDGSAAEILYMGGDDLLHMDGGAVILHASRKIPRAVNELLGRNEMAAGSVGTFVMHQANLHLIERVAAGVKVGTERFFVNIERYGNTSSASLLLAADAWRLERGEAAGREPVVFAAFGAGLNWGALLGMPV